MNLKKQIVLFFVMLVTFWLVSVAMLHPNAGDASFAISVVMFFGSFVAIPAIFYFLFADAAADKFQYPIDAFIYIAIVALGFTLFFVFSERPIPTSQAGQHSYLGRLMPFILISLLPVLYRVAKNVDNKKTRAHKNEPMKSRSAHNASSKCLEMIEIGGTKLPLVRRPL